MLFPVVFQAAAALHLSRELDTKSGGGYSAISIIAH